MSNPLSRRAFLQVSTAALAIPSLCGAGAEPASKKIRVAVVTGGHGFEAKPFFALFEGYPDVEHVHCPQKDKSLFEDIRPWPYDVILFYNLLQSISEKRRANLLALTDRGVGIVVLHHALGSYNEWPEFKRIAGGKFFMYDQKEDGKEYKRSTAGQGVPLKVHVADKEHPITRGLQDFEVAEEYYGSMWFAADNEVLLTTDYPHNDKTIGWVRKYRQSRVCSLQPGHGPPLYGHATYRELIVRAIRWTAGKL